MSLIDELSRPTLRTTVQKVWVEIPTFFCVRLPDIFTQFFNNAKTDNYNSLANTHFQEQPFINPPFEQAQAQLVAYNLNADTGGNIKVNNNSNIKHKPNEIANIYHANQTGLQINWTISSLRSCGNHK